jgi:MFS family permease
MQALRAGRGLIALAAIGASFSAIQLSLGAFAVTTLMSEFGWGGVAAGAAAAAIQTSGAVARLVLAALADSIGAPLPMLAAIGVATAVAALAMPFAVEWPSAVVLLLLCLFGACSAGWTGIAVAEVARLAPPGAAGAATGGVMAMTYVGAVLGPSLFAGVGTLLGSYTAAFAAMSTLPLVGAALALRTHARLKAGPKG